MYPESSLGLAQAPAVADFAFEIPSKAKLGNFFVFFAADLISPEVKSKEIIYREGGLIRESICLAYRHNFIRKCEITQLRPFMESVHVNNVNPNKRDQMIPSYQIIENGRVRTIGLIKTRDGNMVHDGLLRMQFYPADEIKRLTALVDGLVEMPVKTAREALDAQSFLFPNWDRIKAGDEDLPKQMVELERYFKSRLRYDEETKECISSAWERSIVAAAVKSCVDFMTWGADIARNANASYAEMERKGYAWGYGDKAVAVFDQTNNQRKDTVQQNQADQMGSLTENINKLAELAVANAKVPVVPAPPIVNDDEYQRYLRFKAFEESQKQSEPTDTGAEASTGESDIHFGEVVDSETTYCAAISKGTGEPCKGVALANGFCRVPAHQALAQTQGE